MSTLLLRLAGPLQAWGTDSKFNIRQTGLEPSKSGVVGLLAAALGRDRETSVADLAGLRFGVRVVREGSLICDYHTVSRNPNPRPGLNKTDYVTQRYYLSDAVFVSGFEGPDEDFLRTLDQALRFPAYPLFLGRRSCPPTPPISLGVTDAPLNEALMHAECPDCRAGKEDQPMRLVLDAEEATAVTPLIQDMPLSFSGRRRMHGYRPVCEWFVSVPEHNPFGELEG